MVFFVSVSLTTLENSCAEDRQAVELFLQEIPWEDTLRLGQGYVPHYYHFRSIVNSFLLYTEEQSALEMTCLHSGRTSTIAQNNLTRSILSRLQRTVVITASFTSI